MRKSLFTLTLACLLSFALTSQSQAMTVVCANCSDVFTQQMERVTSLEQLKNLMDTYSETIQQTQQQIALVQNNIQQYQNMLQNTANLPKDLLSQAKGQFSQLAKLTNQLKLQKGDYMAMGQVFDEVYPGLELIKNMAGGNGNLNIDQIWKKLSQETDRAAQATFQVTGSQLRDLAENSEALDVHIDKLLSTPEGQMQAIQSGNSLAAIQIDELRQLRALMAVNIQSTVQYQQEQEKKDQISGEMWDAIYDLSSFQAGVEEGK